MEVDGIDVFSNLPSCLWENILLRLDVRDVITCGLSSSRMRDIALAETLWLRIVKQRWDGKIDPARWLTKAACGHFQLRGCKYAFPGTYRALYPVLRDYDQLVGGIWLDPDRDQLCTFHWQPDCLQGNELRFLSMAEPPDSSPVHRLAADGESSAVVIDDYHCWIKQYQVHAGGSLIRPTSQNAQAATLVAIGQLEECRLGSSPTGSFEHELLRFMEGNVSRRRQKSRSKSPSIRSPQAEVIGQFHLRRVPTSPPTRAHPLNGLWKGDFGGQSGVQVITVCYNFSDRRAAISASKAVSAADVHAPPQFVVAAQPMPLPYPTAEVELISERQQYQQTSEPDPDPLLGQQSEMDASEDKTVVACFKGKGRVGDTQHWCAGRLWRYADGDIGFLWLPGNDHDGLLVDFKRIDEEI